MASIKTLKRMRDYILLILVITISSCKPDNQDKSASVVLNPIDFDYDWIKGDMCECYLINGYPANIVSDNCMILSGQVKSRDLWAYLQATSNILLLDSLKSLIVGDNKDKQRQFKADCLERVTSYPVLQPYGVLKSESTWNQELRPNAHKSILSRMYEVRRTQMDKHHLVSIKNLIPDSLPTPTEEKVSIIYVDYIGQSFYVDYVSSKVDSPTVRYLDDLSLSLMMDTMLNDSLVSLTYPIPVH